MSFSSARVNIFICDKLPWNAGGRGSEEESSRKKKSCFSDFLCVHNILAFLLLSLVHLSTWHQHRAFSLDGKYTALTSILIKHKSRCNDHIFIILGCFWSWNKVRTRVSSEGMSCRRAFEQITFEKWLFYDEMNVGVMRRKRRTWQKRVEKFHRYRAFINCTFSLFTEIQPAAAAARLLSSWKRNSTSSSWIIEAELHSSQKNPFNHSDMLFTYSDPMKSPQHIVAKSTTTNISERFNRTVNNLCIIIARLHILIGWICCSFPAQLCLPAISSSKSIDSLDAVL